MTPTDDQFLQATPRERLAFLEAELRKPMPAGFEWNYRYLLTHIHVQKPRCQTAGCALGLARTVWPEACKRLSVLNSRFMLGLSLDDALSLFNCPETYGCERHEDVRPEQVALAIRRYLATDII